MFRNSVPGPNEEIRARFAKCSCMQTSLANLQTGYSLELRALSAQDAECVAAFCAHDAPRLLAPRMHLEAYGYHSPVLQAWGAHPSGKPDSLQGLFFRFHNSVIIADMDGRCGVVFAHLLDTMDNIAGIRGSLEVVRAVRERVQRYRPTDYEDSFFMRLLQPPQIAPQALALTRRATTSDLESLIALYASAGQMYRSRGNVADKLAQVRVFVADAENEREISGPGPIVSSALLNVETSEAGLIGGVYTHPSARGRGYAAACIAALALDLQRDSKLPCLFYENPVAGRVYSRLGFETAGHWAVLYLSPLARHKGS